MTNLGACVALCRADLARWRGDPASEVAFASDALAQADEADDMLRAMARYHLAETDWLAGGAVAAERAMSAIHAQWASSDELLLLLRVGFDLGAVQQAQGEAGSGAAHLPRAGSEGGLHGVGACGHVAGAAAWVRDRGLAVDDEPAYPFDVAYRVLARALIAHSDAVPAALMLRRWRASASAEGRVGHLLAAQVLEAVAHAAARDEPAALAALADALALAAPEGYLRIFLDEGAPIADLLCDAAGRSTAGGPRGAACGAARVRHPLGRCLRPAGHTGPSRSPAGLSDGAGLAEPLSGREREVLGLVAAGKPNRAIAEKLFIGVDTVKRHISHIFVKLGVANRTEAVARARALGLLT